MPIARASMLIRIVYSSSDVSQLAAEIDKIAGQIVQKSSSESDKGESYVDIKIDPEYYRRMEDFVKELGTFFGFRSIVGSCSLKLGLFN